MSYPKLGGYSGSGVVIQGFQPIGLGTEQVYISSLPERHPTKGTMGEYGYDPKADHALVFPDEKRAEWHRKRCPIRRCWTVEIDTVFARARS